jgi:hypothetical protein
MSKADELIAGLQTDAEFDSEGGFSLDREKARQKMRQFQLADPHRYVLLLVEAAVLRGAKHIEFQIDADDMHMRFDAALDWEDLDELYSSLFVDRSSVGIRARRELALACNAAMALNPRFIRIESWQPGSPITGVRALLRPDERDEIERVPKADEGVKAPSTHIHVKDRFRPGLLVRFLHSLGDALPEAELIRERCAMASTAIAIEGNRVSRGLPRDELAMVEFEAEGLRGVAGLHRTQRGRSAVVLLSNGVEIATTELGESVPGLWFWVDSSQFRKDVSQADIVRSDENYEAMLHAIAKARDRVLGRLVQQWTDGQFNKSTQWPSEQVFDLLRSCFLRWADANWMHPEAGPLGMLAELPLWRLADRRWTSPRQLAAEVDPERGIMYTHRDYEGVQPLGWGPIVHVLDGELEIAAVKRVYGESARDITEELDREVPWELNRRRWRTRNHAPKLPRGAELAAGFEPIEIAAGDIVGQLVARPGHRTDVRIVIDGCLLCSIEFDLGVLGLSAVLAGPFEPAHDFAQVRPDRTLATAAMLLLGHIPALLAQLAVQGRELLHIRKSLLALARPDFPGKWLEAFGFEARAAIEMVGRLGRPTLLPDFGLGGEMLAPIAHALTFSTADERTVSLATIDEDRRTRSREQGKVLLVAADAPLTAGLGELILRVDGQERWLLAAIFGSARLHDDTNAYRREIGRYQFLGKPKVSPTLPHATWTTTVEVDSITGLVGISALELRTWQGDEPRRAKIDVIVEGRRLAIVEERAWLPGVTASLVWEQAPINANWDGIAGSTELLKRAVDVGVTQILETHAREAIASGRRPDPEIRRLLWMSMATPFLSSEHAAAWRSMLAKLERSAAIDSYFELLLLFPMISLNDLREAIKLLLEEDRSVTRAAVLEILMRADPGRSGGREFQRAVLDRYELFEQAPLLELCSGASLSLAQLSENFAVTGEIAYVHDLSLHYETDEYVILRPDSIDHVALLRLFGRDMLKEVSAWIHERRHQERFETQAPLAAIRVQDHNRLVGVEFEREGVTGELAIPPWSPAESGLMKLTYCHQRRVVQELEIHAKQPIVGILDDPEAPLSSDFRSIDQQTARMATIRKLLDAVLAEQLLPALADAYPNMGPREKALARDWIADHWRRSSPRAGQYPNRLSAAGRKFAELKLFRDIDQTPRSLAELSERYGEHKKIWFVEVDPNLPVPPPFPVLWVVGSERALLDELFDAVEDANLRWLNHVEGTRRRARARNLPALAAPQNALVTAKVDRHGFTGVLWLPESVPFEPGVQLGSGGKLLSMQHLPLDVLAIQGVIDGVPADEGFRVPVLSSAQQSYLESRAIVLYKELLSQHQRDVARPERPEFHELELVRLRSVRLELLRQAAVSLERARRRGVHMDAVLGDLEKRLVVEPLLRLASGRLISVDVARQARPQEMAHLGIWDPSAPALDPRERARLLLGEQAVPHEDEPTVQAEPEPATEPAPAPAKPEPAPAEPEPLVPPSGPSSPITVELLDANNKVVPLSERDLAAAVLESVRDELRLLRERHQIVLSEGHLDAIASDVRNGRELVRIEAEGVVFDSMHPGFVRAMHDADPVWISFLASVAYTALNRWLDEITDEDELVFHHRHAEHLLSGLLDESTPTPQ